MTEGWGSDINFNPSLLGELIGLGMAQTVNFVMVRFCFGSLDSVCCIISYFESLLY